MLSGLPRSYQIAGNLKKIISGKVIEMLKQLAASNPKEYNQFWQEFGYYIQEGAATENDHPENLYPLLRFRTTARQDIWCSLDDYIRRMVPGQTAIYYLVSDSDRSLKNSTYLSKLRQLGYDALVFMDSAVVFMAETQNSYQDYPFINVANADFSQPETEKVDILQREPSPQEANLAALVVRIHTILADRVEDVRIFTGLENVPARLVEIPGTAPLSTRSPQPVSKDTEINSKRVLELNPNHPILVQLTSLPPENPLCVLIVEQIYENARLTATLHPS